mgnify:CR=1 FL=1
MEHAGYRWSLTREGAQWRWRAVERDRNIVLVEGVAASRAEGAAFLARAMSLGVLSRLRTEATA